MQLQSQSTAHKLHMQTAILAGRELVSLTAICQTNLVLGMLITNQIVFILPSAVFVTVWLKMYDFSARVSACRFIHLIHQYWFSSCHILVSDFNIKGSKLVFQETIMLATFLHLLDEICVIALQEILSLTGVCEPLSEYSISNTQSAHGRSQTGSHRGPNLGHFSGLNIIFEAKCILI